MQVAKFCIYNPSPLDKGFHSICNHIKTGSPYHTIDCYRTSERKDLSAYFRVNERVNNLALPRKQNRKYQQQMMPYRKARIYKDEHVSSRIEHLAAARFRKYYATRQKYVNHPYVDLKVVKNLNMYIQKSMYNMYSRLENVKFPVIPHEYLMAPTIRTRNVVGNYEDRLKLIEKLAQPKKVFEKPEVKEVIRKSRPIDMDLINRLAQPRMPPPDSPTIRCQSVKGVDYYQKLATPKKDFEAIFKAQMPKSPKIGLTERTKRLAVQWQRLASKKFRKIPNPDWPKVSKSSLNYKASAKIKKLAEPKLAKNMNGKQTSTSKKGKK